jgi:hypothetical protein
LNEFERHIKVLDAKIDDRSILESEFALLDSDQFKKFSKVVPMSPGEIKSFEFHYQGVRRIRDHLIWSLNTSGSGVDFWIRPSNRIVVSAHFYHPSQAIEQIETSTNAMPIRINIRKPVMARTPLEINWRPRTTT